MGFKEPSQEEMKKAMARIDELLADPVKFEKWLDRAIQAWRKKRRNYRLEVNRLVRGKQDGISYCAQELTMSIATFKYLLLR